MHQNKRIIMWLHEQFGEGNENVKTIVDALEKQIPKKPIDRAVCKDGIITFGDVGTCPNCGHIVAEDMFVCEDCLQVLDWEVGE
jgi:hypothetical protein